MATDNDKVKDLYNFLHDEGYDFMGSESEFREKLKDSSNASSLHDFLRDEGYDFMGTREEFYGKLNPVTTPTAAPTQQQPKRTYMPAEVYSQTGDKRIYEPDSSEAYPLQRQQNPAKQQPTQQRHAQQKPPTAAPAAAPTTTRGMVEAALGKPADTSITYKGKTYEDTSKFVQGIPQQKDTAELAKSIVEDAKKKADEKKAKQERQDATRAQVDELSNSIDEQMQEVNQKATQAWRERDSQRGFFSKLGHALANAEDPSKTGELAHMYDNYPEMNELTAAKRSLDNAKNMIAEADHNAAGGFEGSFVAGVGRGFGQKFADVSTWDFGMSDLMDATKFMKILDKADKGKELTKSEQALLDAKVIEIATSQYFGDEVGRGYKAGSVTAESIPFMVEMMVNPLAGAGQGAEKMLARYALKRFASKNLAKGASKTAAIRAAKKAMEKGGEHYVAGRVVQGVGRAVVDVLGAGGMAATTGAARTDADAIDRMTGDVHFKVDDQGRSVYDYRDNQEKWFDAWRKAFLSTTIENYSEMFGNYFSPLMNAVGKGAAGIATSKFGKALRLDKVKDMVNNVSTNDWGRLVSDFEKRANWHGSIGEFGEEIVGGVLNAILVGDQTLDTDKQTGVFNLDNLIDTFLGVSIMGGAFSAVNTGGYALGRHRLNRADAEGRNAFGEDLWNTWQQDLSSEDDEVVKQALKTIAEDKNLREDQKKAAFKYASAASGFRTLLAQEEKRREDPETDPAEIAERVAFDNGYDADEEMQRDIMTEAEMGGEPTAEQQAAVDGVRRRIEDDADMYIAGERDANKPALRKDGSMQLATLKEKDANGNDKVVYIVDGNVVMTPDGSMVDPESSDRSVIIYDPATGERKMIDPTSGLGVQYANPIVTAEEFELSLQNKIRRYIQQRLDEVQGTVNVTPGQQIDMPDGTEATVIAADGENITIQTADGQQQTMPQAEVQRIADELKMADYMERHPEAQQETEQPTEETSEQPTDNIVEGAPSEFVPNTRIMVRDDDGESKEAVVQGRVRYDQESRQFVPDENGQVIEYLMDGEMHHDQINALKNKVEGYVAAPAAETETAPEEVATTEQQEPPTEQTEEVPTTEEMQQPTEEPTASEQAAPAREPMPMHKVRKKIDGKMQEVEEEDYMATTPSRAYQYLYEEAVGLGLKPETADNLVQAKIKAAQNGVEKAAKATGPIVSILQKQRDAQAEVDYWNEVAAMRKSAVDAEKQAEYERKKAEMERNVALIEEQKRKDAERHDAAVERMERERAENAARKAAEIEKEARNAELRDLESIENEIYDDVRKELGETYSRDAQDRKQRLNSLITMKQKRAAAMEMYGEYFNDDIDTPSDIYELVAEGLTGLKEDHKINWDMVNNNPGVKQEIGGSHAGRILRGKKAKSENAGDFDHLSSVISFDNQGESLRKVAHRIWESEENSLPGGNHRYDDDEIADTIIDMLLSADSPSYFKQYSFNNRVNIAEEAFAKRINDAVNREVEWMIENSGLTYSEYVEWYRNLRDKATVVEKMTEEEYREFENQLIENEYGREEESAAVSGTERPAESRTNEGSGETSTETLRRPEGESAGVVQDAERGDEEGDGAAAEQPAASPIAESIAQQEVNENPTEAQKEAGNYKKAHVKVDGLDITIENKKGSTRSGVDPNGRAWSQTMNNDYGYIRGTVGFDKDHIDVFLSDDPEFGWVYVIDQRKADGTFDEHKVMYGFDSVNDAINAYLSNYEEGWQGLGYITSIDKKTFENWIHSSRHKTKPFKDYKGVKNKRYYEGYGNGIVENGVQQGGPAGTVEQPTAEHDSERGAYRPVTNEWFEIGDNVGAYENGKLYHGDIIDWDGEQFTIRETISKRMGEYRDHKAWPVNIKPGSKKGTAKSVATTEVQLTSEQRVIGQAMVDQLENLGEEVITDLSEMRRVHRQAEQDKSESGRLRHFRASDGKIYGFTYRGKIYLDSRRIDAEVPIHEYAHPWCEAFRMLNPEGWKEVVNMMQGDRETWELVKALNPDLTDPNDIVEEMIAHGSGENGKARAEAEYRRMGNGSNFGNVWNNIAKAIQDFWKKIGDFLNIKYETPEQIYDQVVKDFANKVNPRKRIEDYLKERDAEYLQAVESGDEAKARELFDAALRENIGNGMTPYVAAGKYRGGMDILAKGVKSRDPKVIAEVADLLAPLIPENAVLVPAPSHSGTATDMLDVANAIAERTGAPVADVLRSEQRASQYEAKKQGQPISSSNMGIHMEGQLPEGRIPIVIDNVVDTGNTAEACIKALGKGVVVSLADAADRRKHVSSLKSANVVVRDKNGEVVPLSRRFDLGGSNYLAKQKGEQGKGVSEMQKALVNGLVSLIRSAKVDITTARQEGQRMLDKYRAMAQLMNVWHGSGADFDKFDRNKIGSGQGAQTFGNGHYVTQVKDIGKKYAQEIGDQTRPATFKGLNAQALGYKNQDFFNSVGATDADKVSALLSIVRSLNYGVGNPVRMIQAKRESLQSQIRSDSYVIKRKTQDLNKETDETKRKRIEDSIKYYENKIEKANDIIKFVDTLNPKDFDGWSKSEGHYLYEVEIPDDNGSNYLEWDKPIREDQLTDIDNNLALQGIRRQEVSGTLNGEQKTFIRFTNDNAIVELYDGMTGEELYRFISRLFAGNDKSASEFLHNAGFTGIKYPAEYLSGGRSDGAKNYVIFDDGDLKIVDKIRFHKAENGDYVPEMKPIFYSNAMKAVEGIKQEKATAEQWLAMLQKNGGLKAGEDKWIGLSDWLNDHKGKSLTKQELMDYIRENQIQVEEVEYGDNGSDKLDEFNNEFKEFMEEAEEATGSLYVADYAEWAFEQMKERYGDDFEQAFELENTQKDGWRIVPQLDYNDEMNNAAKNFLDANPVNNVRLNYTTDFLENKREIALTIPTIEPWNESDDIHFGDAGDGRAVAWVRFGETTMPSDEQVAAAKSVNDYLAEMREKYGSAEGEETDRMTEEEIAHLQNLTSAEAEAKNKPGKRVLVIDEIQSKRHQEGREKGYRTKNDIQEEEQLQEAVVKAQERYDDFTRKMGDKYGGTYEDIYSIMSGEDQREADRLKQEVYEADDTYQNHSIDGIPDAPFEKNWHEVMMKRMLRYAAENGYDKVAWTTGEQQAERYDLSKSIKDITATGWTDYSAVRGDDAKEAKLIAINTIDGGEYAQLLVDKSGNVISDVDDQFVGKQLSDIVGKDLAKRLMEDGYQTIEGEGLRIGGEGMKGFYDQILPRFMDKYGKKWNVKTTDINLPNIGDNGLVMHSIDVTPEMKASVMEGQPMFFRTEDGEVWGYALNGKIYIDPSVATPETPIHEYTHLWTSALRKINPAAWERLKDEMRQQEGLMDYVRSMYPELTNEDELLDEVFAHYSGKRGAERLEADMRDAIAKEKDYTMKAQVAMVFHKLRDILQKFWSMARDLFAGKVEGVEKLSADDFADMALGDLMNGFKPEGANGGKRLTEEDRTYLAAVERGDMETAQRMVNEAAERAGYTANDDYKDGHHAPGSSVYRKDFQNLEAIRETVENDGAASNLFAMAQGVSLVPDDYFSVNGPRWYGYQNWTSGMEAYYNLRNVINEIQRQVRENGEVKDMPTIKVYRAVPKNIKAGQLESGGQWVSPSREYAVNHGRARFGFGEYRIIEQEVRADELWFDGNDIREWCFDDDTSNAYQNTKNNRKLLDAVTYDDNGNLIPLSKRFNKRNADIRYQKVGEINANTIDEVKDEVLKQFDIAKTGEAKGKPIHIGNITNEGRELLQKISGFKMKPTIGFNINTSDLRHIYNDHYGDNEKDKGKNIPLTDDDIRAMVDVITNPDEIIYGVEKGGEGRKLFFFLKDAGEGSYNLTEVYADKRGNLTAKTYYKTKKGSNLRAVDLVNDPELSTSKTSGASLLSGAKIPTLFETAKNNLQDTDNEDSVYFRSLDPESDAVVDNAEVGTRPLSDREKVAKLEAEPKVKVYRSMQLIDGELYPPMSAKSDGQLREPSRLGVWEEADERPDMADSNGKFTLNKGNGKSLKAAYNPYIHSSRSMLNDQFSEAQTRPNLVVVEMEVPESELTSGYKAEKAKDSVGAKKWKAGVIQGQLSGTREVILSRWAKPVRIIPDSEVAASIAEQIKGQVAVMPSNVVTPSVRAELEKLGVQFVETDNSGRLVDGPNKGKTWSKVYGKNNANWAMSREGDGISNARTYGEALESARRAGYTKKQFDQMLKDQERRHRQRVADFIDKLNLTDRVTVVDSIDEVEGLTKEQREQRRDKKGWYDRSNGRIVVILDNHHSVDDILKTVLHEGVAHHGLRALFGKNFDNFIDNVYAAADYDVRLRINELAKQKNWDIRTATEEYLAGLAEDTEYDNIENSPYAGWWTKIKTLFFDMLHKLGIAGETFKQVLSDNELRYLLWRSYKNLTEPGRFRSFVDEAEDVVMQDKLKVGDYEVIDYAHPRQGGERKRPDDAENTPKDNAYWNWVESLEGNMYTLEEARNVLRNAYLEYPHATGERKEQIQGAIEALRPWIELMEQDEEEQENGAWWSQAAEQQSDAVMLGHDGDTYKAVGKSADAVSKALGIPKAADGSLSFPASDIDNNLPKLVRSGLRVGIADRLPEGASEDDVMFRDGDDTPRAIARDTYERMMQSGVNQFTEAVQDSALSLKKLYEAILKEQDKKFRIEDVKGYENAYLAENRMASSSEAQVHAWQKDYYEPIVKAVNRLMGGHYDREAYDDVTDYMMAKHGLERNEVMARRDAERAAEKDMEPKPEKPKDESDTAAMDAYNQKLQDWNDQMHALADSYYIENRQRDYAGLTALTGEADVATAEAAAQFMVDMYEGSHDADDIDALWNAVNNATKSILRKIAESGMLSPERYKEIRDMYQYYIPLQGFDSKVAEEVYAYLGSDGTLGYGTPIKTAKGRKSKADDPLATISLNGEAAIRKGNRNLMKQNFLRFAESHPSDLVSISDVWLRKNDVTGEWEQYFDADIQDGDSPEVVAKKVADFEETMEALSKSDPEHYKRSIDLPDVPYRVLQAKDMNQHQVLVQRGGKTYILTINGNPRAAQALNGLTNPDVFTEGVFGKAMNAGRWFNRQLSAFYTTRNPIFMLGNFLRDTIYTNSMAWVKESPSYAIKFHKNFGKMNPVHMGQLFATWENGHLREKILNGNASETERMFYDFMMNGGETGWTSLRDIEKQKRDLEKALKREGNMSKKAWKALGGAFDLANRSVENCARFAAFVTSREMGRSLERSIWDAKEVSVNFNKKGASDKFINAKGQKALGVLGAAVGGLGRGLYVFFNASLQGLHNIGKASKSHPWKAAGLFTSLFSLGAVMPILSAIIGGDDDDDDKDSYYNLPEYVRRSNICFRWSKNMPWITIPLPIEFRAVYGMGELAMGMLTGKERYSDEEAGKQFVSQLSQVLPLDFMEGGGGWHAFIPSQIKPFVEANQNVSWTGLPIYREETPWNENNPQWARAYQSANQQIVDFTKWLNEQTGGDDVTQGWIDWNPAKIEYMMKGYLGGYFTMYDLMQKTAETALGKRDFEWRNIPFANRVLKEGDERTQARKTTNDYFNMLDDYKKIDARLKAYKKMEKDGEMGPVERANYIDLMNNDVEYTKYLIIDAYSPVLKEYHKLSEEAETEAEKKQLKATEAALRKQCVDLIHAIENGKDIDADAEINAVLIGIIRDDDETIDIRKKAQSALKKLQKKMAER